MLDYAGQIFASRFEPAALIVEERLSPEQFFTGHTGYGDPDNGGLFSLPLPPREAQDQLDAETSQRQPPGRLFGMENVIAFVCAWEAGAAIVPEASPPNWRLDIPLGSLKPYMRQIAECANLQSRRFD
jgi:hypothetical protein